MLVKLGTLFACFKTRQSTYKMTDILKKEIQFRGQRRGIKELDMIMGRFIENELNHLNEDELTALRNILLESDLDLLAYFQNEKPLPPHLNADLFIKIKKNYHPSI